MKPRIKTIIAYVLLLLLLSGCTSRKAGVPISETGVTQEAYTSPAIPSAGDSTENTEDSTESIESSTEQPEAPTEDTESSTENAQGSNGIETAGNPSNNSDGTGAAPENTGNTVNPATLTSSMSKLLQTSIMPVGSTMYIWGGGWNEEDTGSGIESVTIGLSPAWAQFAAQQSSGYDHQATRYQIHNGLDCSGYIGWLIYNTFHSNNGEPGYVCKATSMASTLSSYGWGSYIYAGDSSDFQPGDICSMSGHVWMCLGKCSDGSVLLIHSSPPGVRICGTQLSDGSASQAVALAENIMSTCYPDWYQRYPDCAVNYSYLTSSSKMRWSTGTLSDAGSYQGMSAEDIAAFLFPSVQ